LNKILSLLGRRKVNGVFETVIQEIDDLLSPIRWHPVREDKEVGRGQSHDLIRVDEVAFYLVAAYIEA